MKKFIAIISLVFFSSSAFAEKEMHAVPPSGLPDMLFKETDAATVSDKIANRYVNAAMGAMI